MANNILELFSDASIVRKIQERLPKLFYFAELESSRAGKVGMEVGSVREKILIALLMYKYGEKNVGTDIPITEPEVDVKVFGNSISIKTITSHGFNSVKLIWTVDAEQAASFSQTYQPACDMMLAQISWGRTGGLFYFPRSTQISILNKIGRQRYIKLPKQGTNPRGVEITAEALRELAEHKDSKKIPITWVKGNIEFKAYQRWLELWMEG